MQIALNFIAILEITSFQKTFNIKIRFIYDKSSDKKVSDTKRIQKKEVRCSDSLEVVKNGSNSVGKQKYKCKACKRQFTLNPYPNNISVETK